MRTLLSALFALLTLLGEAASAQSLPRFGAPERHVDAELIAATDAIVPGQALAVALRLKHKPEWHTYWQVPGDSGLPTRIDWKLPAGFTAGPIEWPHPKRLPTGPLVNFGFEGETLLLTSIRVPAELPVGGQVTLAGKAEWLECKDVCIPGESDIALTLPVKASSGPSAHAPRFEATRTLIPQPLGGTTGQGTIDGSRIKLSLALPAGKTVNRLEFFPLEEGRIEPAAPQVLRREGAAVELYLTAAKPVKADAKAIQGVLVANGGPAAGGWIGSVDLPLAAGTVAPVSGPAATSAAASMSLVAALGAALLGGLILNLMPCVFPVLSLKVIGLAQHRTHSGPLAAHGLAFAAGVVLSFLLLAGALIGLQQAGNALGWGFQLQTPWVVAALTVLFFLIGLNLLGVYEFTFGSSVANAKVADGLTRKGDWRGSFGTGVLAVIVASPCTAPFMGAALGYAVTQPAAVALAVFAALGVGMATPYLVLTLFPALLRKLPRPGHWMDLFKQFMAFPMFATCVWLVWVLAQQVDAGRLALVLAVVVALGFAAWAYGLSQRGAYRFRWAALAGVLVAALAFAPLATHEPAAAARAASSDDWVDYSPEKLAQLTKEGKPVFVDFTAAWCVTCQYNKSTTLANAEVLADLSAKKVALLRADWTRRDPAITAALAQLGRNGVPVYVFYKQGSAPVVLSEILGVDEVRSVIAKL